MKLWLITQTENEGYDTYDSAVVAADTEEAARHIHPSMSYLKPVPVWGGSYSDWASSPNKVSAKHIGEALEGVEGVVCASFNAG